MLPHFFRNKGKWRMGVQVQQYIMYKLDKLKETAFGQNLVQLLASHTYSFLHLEQWKTSHSQVNLMKRSLNNWQISQIDYHWSWSKMTLHWNCRHKVRNFHSLITGYCIMENISQWVDIPYHKVKIHASQLHIHMEGHYAL